MEGVIDVEDVSVGSLSEVVVEDASLMLFPMQMIATIGLVHV